ncbi:MAG: sigma-70 family RNA polymerase sigma factor, partial [Candidatus Aminicenantes bacterium]
MISCSMETPEIKLIEKAKQGSQEAISELLAKEQNFILNFMYQLTGNRAEAEDLTQEALIMAYRKIHTFLYKARFRTWLSKIALNLFRQKHRQERQHESHFLEKIIIPEEDGNPERTVIKSELQWCILHSLQQHLPPKYRMVLVLRDLQNFSYKEISETLGWSVSKTKTRL